jgi:hypothetical protein
MRCGEAAGQTAGDVGYVALAATVLREALADAATSGEAEAVLERLGALLPSKPDLLCAPDARFVMRVVDYLTPLNDRGPKAVKAATALTRLPTLIPAMLHALSANSWALMRQLAYLACYALSGEVRAGRHLWMTGSNFVKGSLIDKYASQKKLCAKWVHGGPGSDGSGV